MSDLTTIARPYAKAAFDFAVEKGELDQWGQMLTFAAEVAQNDDIVSLLNSSTTASKLAEIFIVICGEQFDAHGQNFIKVMAENGRLNGSSRCMSRVLRSEKEHEKEIDVEVTSAVELSKEQLRRHQQQIGTAPRAQSSAELQYR